MSKSGKVDLVDLTLAPRRPAKAGSTSAPVVAATDTSSTEAEAREKGVEPGKPAVHAPAQRGLLSTPAETRREAARAKAIEREDAASRLRGLKKSKDRESRHFINIPLDWETKKALEDAAHEHGLKMTVIVRDALAVYLRDAGYLR